MLTEVKLGNTVVLKENKNMFILDDNLDQDTCPECGELLEFEYENNGFTMPNGPEHIEVSKVFCPQCGYEE